MAHAEQIKAAGDVMSISTAIATIAGWLPAAAAVVSIIYTALRIYEWFEKRPRARWPRPWK